MADAKHEEQQAVLRQLNEFENTVWPAFKRRGFGSMGDAYIAYLLMQLVSARAVELADAPPLRGKIAVPLSAADAEAAAPVGAVAVAAKVGV